MLHRLLTGTAAVVAVLVPAAAAQAAPAVSVRVEGVQRTLLPATSVAQSGQAPPVSGCDGSSAGAALDRATGGDWDRQPFASTILGEAHDFSAGDYWAEWIGRGGGFVFGAGLCSDELQAGDELLMLVDVTAAPDYASTAFPLAVRDVPARVAPGVPFTVRVRRWRPDAQGTPGSGVEEAAAGAAVEVAGRSVAADAEGRATLALPARGPAEVRAVATTTRSASVPLCVTDGADGACGTAAGGGPSAAPAPAPPCATTGDDGLCGTPDRRPPWGKITSIREGQQFAHRRGPRRLAGIVKPEPSGIAAIRLRLTRRVGGRCQTYDGRAERLVRVRRCGARHGRWFALGTRDADWSYLLPARLGRGRWVLDLRVSDGAGNVDRLLQRTRTRVVFAVR